MTTPAPEDNAKQPSEMSMAEIIADCRRKQQLHERRIPVQLEILWSSEQEAVEQWRSETEPEEWVTFPEDWIEP